MTILVICNKIATSRWTMGTWGVAQAKAQFSEVIAKAMTEGPQEITKGGKDAVVVVSKKEWMERAEQSKPKQNMAEFLLNSPLRGSGLKLPSRKWKTRPVKSEHDAATTSAETAKSPKRSAADFWLRSPLRGSDIKLPPFKGKLREVEF